MNYFINKYKQNKAILKQATKVMRNLQHSKELLQNGSEDYEKERKDKCLSTNLERNIIDTPLELNMSSEYDEYSDFSEDSTQKLPDDATRDDNEHELIKNIEKVIKGNRNKNNDKQRLSVNHSAQLLDSTKNINDQEIKGVNRK